MATATVPQGRGRYGRSSRLLLTRRQLLKAGGLTAIAAGVGAFGPRLVGTLVQPGRALAADKPPNLKLVGTDGWISLPPDPPIFSNSLGVTVHPDPYAPDGKSTYIFGFANASGLADDVQFNLKNKAQHSAPLFWARQEEDFRVQLTNVGLAQRPDLFDEHTLHWHGFRTSSRSSTASPPGPSRSRRARPSPTSTSHTTPAPTCSTATWRTRSTCTWG